MNTLMYFPEQKISQTKKTVSWYKKNIDFASEIFSSDTSYINTLANKTENYDLRLNKINPSNFERYLDPSKLGMGRFPADLKHIGVGNAKIDLLVGDYISRKIEARAYLSSKDEDGNSRKEEGLKNELMSKIAETIQQTSLDEKELESRMSKLQEWMTYDYQDIAEKTANQILDRESKENNFEFLFTECFKDLLIAGSPMVLIDILGKKPVIRRIDPRSVYTIGGDTMYLHEKDMIIMHSWKSLGQIYDDYWDVLTETDRENLNKGANLSSFNTQHGWGYEGIKINNDSSQEIRPHPEQDNTIVIPNSNLAGLMGTRYRNLKGDYREVTVFWRGKRKILELTYIDEFGESQTTYAPEGYIPDEEAGETTKVLWINEWYRATKIGADVYVKMEPIQASAKSLTNLSYGLPPIIGLTLDQSFYDKIKPLDYEIDIAYFKRTLAVNTYKGNATAINTSMIPTGWDPEKWLAFAGTDKILYLDPTQEINKGIAQGKLAGSVMNTFITQEVSLGSNVEEIRMWSDYMAVLIDEMGRISGVHGAREGDIGQRDAVRNTQVELTQFSKITEHWFLLDAEFRRFVLKKFLEVCKLAYKDNPQRGAYILDDMGQEFIQHYSEFSESEFDIHVNDSSNDKELFENLKQLAQAAIQNGNARIDDLITIYTTNSTQKIARKLRDAAERISREAQEQKKQEAQYAMQIEQAKQAAIQAQNEWQSNENQLDRELEVYKSDNQLKAQMAQVEVKERDSIRKSMVDNSKPEMIEVNDTDPFDIEKFAKELQLKYAQLNETRRHNIATEKISKIQKKTAPKK